MLTRINENVTSLFDRYEHAGNVSNTLMSQEKDMSSVSASTRSEEGDDTVGSN